MRRLSCVLLVLACVAGGALAGGSTAAAPVRGVQLSGYDWNPSTRVLTVRGVKPYGWKMYPKLVGSRTNRPDGGHWVLIVNGKRAAAATGAKATAKNLPKTGTLRFYVRLANNDHSAVKGAARPDVYTVS